MQYTIYKKSFGMDIDVMWDEFLSDGYLDTMEEAKEMAAQLEEQFSDPLWEGHPYYRSSFYAAEITPEEVNRNWSNWQWNLQPV